jgi:uncharacterized FlgJ-related protein
MNADEIKKMTSEAEQAKQELANAYKAYFIASAKTILLDKIYPMIDFKINRLAKDRQYNTWVHIRMGDFFNDYDKHNTEEIEVLITEHYKSKGFKIKSESYTNWGCAGSGQSNPTIHFDINWR